jgi:hypothetical protein
MFHQKVPARLFANFERGVKRRGHVDFLQIHAVPHFGPLVWPAKRTADRVVCPTSVQHVRQTPVDTNRIGR